MVKIILTIMQNNLLVNKKRNVGMAKSFSKKYGIHCSTVIQLNLLQKFYRNKTKEGLPRTITVALAKKCFFLEYSP